MDVDLPPILDNKQYGTKSIFAPAALLREARRQKKLAAADVPPVCIPDGDIVRLLRATGQAKRFADWPCYHTDLDLFLLDGETVGIIGCAVGAPFAVLVAEELFACGCCFLISMTSAGQIALDGAPPYFMVIARALRDEGTSYHYSPPSSFAEADPQLVALVFDALNGRGLNPIIGTTWTTDAPFRETAAAIDAARKQGIRAVEMEAAALYAFAHDKSAAVLA